MVVRGQRSAREALTTVRKHARRLDLTLVKLPKRGKDSHAIYALRDKAGNELARVAIVGHSGDMSHAVTRSVEDALEPIFGKGWLDT